MSTAVTPQAGGSLESYQLRLPGYEGPLDVLLRLIERNQLEITDVSLVTVTSQFLDYVTSLTETPEQVIASFATVGTRLAVLKSRSLLPRPNSVDEEDGPSDLTRQLLEYRQALDTSAFLTERASLDLRSYTRAANHGVDAELQRSAERLGHYSPTALVQALRRRLIVLPPPPQMVPRRKPVSLRETVRHILEVTSIGARVPFSRVVAVYASRTEVATAFLGVLVLVKREAVEAGQAQLFGEIDLRRYQHSPTTEKVEERFDGQ